MKTAILTLVLAVIFTVTNAQTKKKIDLGTYGKMKVAEQQSFMKEVQKISIQIKARDSVHQLFLIQFIAASGVDMKLVSFAKDSVRVTSDSIILKLRRKR